MKMLPHHYERLAASIQGPMGITRAERWDALWSSSILGNRPEVWICEVLYPYLNDDHIDTALRRLQKERRTD